MTFQKTPIRVQFPLLSFPLIFQFKNKYVGNINSYPFFVGKITEEKAGDEEDSWTDGL